MNVQTKYFFLSGDAGQIQCAMDSPETTPIGIALVAHPHPLFGGTMNNKVVQTLARTFVGLGYAVGRMNFRGVEKSEGVHDNGLGETDDMRLLLEHMQNLYPGLPTGLPIALAGFSFGTFVQSRLGRMLSPLSRLRERGGGEGGGAIPDASMINDPHPNPLPQAGEGVSSCSSPAMRLVLVGCAAGKWDIGEVPADTVVIHGEEDDTIPLIDVFDWARPQDLAVAVIPGAGHFFHHKLHHIKNIVTALW